MGWLEMTLSPEQAARVYDRIGRAQDTQGFYERPAVELMLDHADLGAAHSVLELGCGTGKLAAELLADHLPGAATYLGLDVSPRMVELASGRVAPWGERAEVRLTDGSAELPVEDGGVDRIIAAYVFDLLDDALTEELLRSARRALGAEGRLCLVGLTPGSSGVARAVSAVWTAAWRLRPELTGGCRPVELGGRLEAAGWRLLHRETVSPWAISSEVVVAAPRQESRPAGG